MPFRTLKLLPGVNIERSPTLNETQLSQSNLIRFYSGLVQKLGGWAQIAAQAFVGVCRGLHGWADIIGNAYLAVGTDQRLEVFEGGALGDITPLAATTNPSVSFSTVISTAVVTITDGGYAPSAGDWINLLTQVSVGGVVLFGFYQVQTVVDSTHYTVAAASNATSTVNNGGAVPDYTTVNTQSTVSVALANHGLIAGSLFDAAVSTTVATVVISGIYSVTTRTDANNFVITTTGTANASTSGAENGGDARIEYLLPSGYAVNTALTGYGIGDYGAGDYGLAGSGQTVAPLRQWSLDHFGQDLVASPSEGGIYYWQPPTIQPATVMPNAPLYNIVVFVMSQVQIVVSGGAEISGTLEPLLIRWCDAGDFTDWIATATNQAGSYQLSSGSRVMAGLAVGLGCIIWTDVDLWSMAYQGLPYVFAFNRIATACGIISQRAAGISGTLVLWLSSRGFFSYQFGGGVTPMECPVWDFFINNVDPLQFDQVHCAPNSLFNEMAWFFPIASTSPLYTDAAPLGYVKFNYVENCWDYGLSSQYQRTAWVGRSPVGNPIGADLMGLLQQHEVGMDANGAGMAWFWRTGAFSLADGEEFAFLDLIIPDFVTIGSPMISVTAYPSLYPNTPGTPRGPYTFGADTPFVSLRVRAREIALGAAGSDIGTFNRLGALRYRFAPDGRV